MIYVFCFSVQCSSSTHIQQITYISASITNVALSYFVATVEIAWPEKHIGFMTAEQAEDKGKLEGLGWKILSLIDATDANITNLFGGEN